MASRIRSYLPRIYGTLKEASATLIESSGGLNKAAERCRLKKSRLAECTDPAAHEAHLPVDVVLTLELSSGARPITEYLASSHGCVLIQLPPAEARGAWGQNIAAAAKESAEVFAKAAEFLSNDGDICAKEAPELLREVDEALAAFGDLREALVAVLRRNG